MHTEFEELVRDSMEWFTEDLQVPADLAGNARRAHQRRPIRHGRPKKSPRQRGTATRENRAG